MSSNDLHIVDTVVLLYFLLVDRFDLLEALIGTPVQVPFSVYDPDDPRDSAGSAARSDLTSEMRQAIRHYEANALSTNNRASLDRIARVDALHDEGRLVAVAMTDDERHLAAEVQSRDRTKQHGIRVPLGPGEAACVAIACTRGWTIATDDADALAVMRKLTSGTTFPYERIRKLLTRAGAESHLTNAAANAIHAEMRVHGFWDMTAPFP